MRAKGCGHLQTLPVSLPVPQIVHHDWRYDRCEGGIVFLSLVERRPDVVLADLHISGLPVVSVPAIAPVPAVVIVLAVRVVSTAPASRIAVAIVDLLAPPPGVPRVWVVIIVVLLPVAAARWRLAPALPRAAVSFGFVIVVVVTVRIRPSPSAVRPSPIDLLSSRGFYRVRTVLDALSWSSPTRWQRVLVGIVAGILLSVAAGTAAAAAVVVVARWRTVALTVVVDGDGTWRRAITWRTVSWRTIARRPITGLIITRRTLTRRTVTDRERAGSRLRRSLVGTGPGHGRAVIVVLVVVETRPRAARAASTGPITPLSAGLPSQLLALIALVAVSAFAESAVALAVLLLEIRTTAAEVAGIVRELRT